MAAAYVNLISPRLEDGTALKATCLHLKYLPRGQFSRDLVKSKTMSYFAIRAHTMETQEAHCSN